MQSLRGEVNSYSAIQLTTHCGCIRSIAPNLFEPLPLLCRSSYLWKRDTSVEISSALESAFFSGYWVWTPQPEAPVAPVGDIVLRRTFSTPDGKSAQYATAVMTADNLLVLFVNGQPIGATPDRENVWQEAQKFTFALNATSNTFVVRATNQPEPRVGGPGAAAFLGAVEIHYTDGSSDIISSDASWKATEKFAALFYLSEFDDSQWPAAAAIAQYGIDPWGTRVSIPPAETNSLSISDSEWMWTGDTAAPRVAFRRTIPTPADKTAESAAVLVAADRSFRFFLNGELVGSPPSSEESWRFAQRFYIPLNGHTNYFVATAEATAAERPSGLIVAIEIRYSDGTTENFRSGSSWEAATNPPEGVEFPSTDAEWTRATSLGTYGMNPWQELSIADAYPVFLTNVTPSTSGPPIMDDSADDSDPDPEQPTPEEESSSTLLQVPPVLFALPVVFGCVDRLL
ncbi:hypothetical protein AX16_001281 [Volvariella volvacea WC 439]|nr:hypothetical protein AX16_001281 [Volvariella volvacea WC 439]